LLETPAAQSISYLIGNQKTLSLRGTGKVIGTITLGKSVKFNTGGTFVTPLADGGLYINGFFGPVRIAAPAK
jgi:hypothetical protein